MAKLSHLPEQNYLENANLLTNLSACNNSGLTLGFIELSN